MSTSPRPLIGRLNTLLRELGPAERREVAALARPARERAVDLWEAAGRDADAASLAACAYLGEMLAGLSLVHEWRRVELEPLLGLLAGSTGRSRSAITSEVYGDALQAVSAGCLPPNVAIAACLRLLVGFAPVGEASLWTRDTRGTTECVALVGAERPTRRVRAAARENLNGATAPQRTRGLVHGIPVLRWDAPCGALVVRTSPADLELALAHAREASRVLAAALERDLLLQQGAARDRVLLEAGERRLARLGLDIHDGPLQDLTALGIALLLFRRQLEQLLPSEAPRDLLLRRLEDSAASMQRIHEELRELAHSLERKSILEQPFGDLLRRQAAAFTARDGIQVKVDLRGHADALSRSQRLALVALVREALTNVRDHSGASQVTITVSAGPAYTHATVTDNGRGFDVEDTLARATKNGRLGLMGMGERVLLLGGTMTLESKPGGPTRLSVALPRWEPFTADRRAA